MTAVTKKEQRIRRARRVRAKISGTASRPRLSVFKSNTRITAQVIDDENTVTLMGLSSSQMKKGSLSERVEEMGKKLAEDMSKAGITTVVFDRAGFLYAGNIKKLADTLRASGITF